MARPAAGVVRPVALLLAVALLAAGAAGQGLRPSSSTIVGASNTGSRLQALYQNSRAWAQAYRRSPRSACSKANGASLCASGSADALQREAALNLATAPSAYSSASPADTGNLNVVPVAGDQGECNTCSAFAVTAAASMAMAAATRTDVRQCSFSPQGLFFCGPGPEVDCTNAWTLQQAVDALQSQYKTLPTTQCLPYTVDPRAYEFDRATLCKGKCDSPNALASSGTFSSRTIREVWTAQRHIRMHGSVVARFDVPQGMREFFSNKANAKNVYKPAVGAPLAETHAVAVVGYVNDESPEGGHWIVLNSWGPTWGDNGLFRVAYGSCNLLTPGEGEAVGLMWKPASPPAALQLPVKPAPGKPNCFLYKAVPGDYLSRVAFLTNIKLETFVLDNVDRIKDLDFPLAGTELLVCNPKLGSVKSLSGGAITPKVSGVANSQADALLQIKAVLDPTGVGLKTWTADTAAKMCESWDGVVCAEGSSTVEKLYLWPGNSIEGMTGTLPSATLLAALPGLEELQVLDQPGVAGTLPADWSKLTNLVDLRVTNTSVTGNLPASWSSLRKLNVLYLHDNKLTGPLPDAWKALTGLAELEICNNQLQGTLPDSWKALTQLHNLLVWGNAGLTGTLPASWSSMTQLRSFGLGSTKLSGPLPNAWKAFTLLEDFDASDASLSGPLPASWSSMTKLQNLQLYSNSVTGPLPDAWKSMTAMANFSAATNALTGPLPASWSSWTKLLNFYVHNNKLTGPLPPAWSGWSRIVELSVINNSLSGPLPDSWKAMTAVQTLNLGLNSFSGTLPASWSVLPRLNWMAVNGNGGLSGTLPDAWKALTALEELYAWGNKLTGPLPASWSALYRLRHLELSTNQLAGALPDAWSALTAMEVLYLDANKFTGRVPASWDSMKSLTSVALNDNAGLAGCVPASWTAQLNGNADFDKAWVTDGTKLALC